MKNIDTKQRNLPLDLANDARLGIDELVQHKTSRETGYVISPSIHSDLHYWVMMHRTGVNLCHANELDTEIGSPFRKGA